jgi:spore coat polysaccharide biosynthesis predicted glycosyltransferase SpsG
MIWSALTNCDVLLDQNWYGERTENRYSYRVPAECRKLLGPRYALLHPEYARLAGNCTARQQLKTVLVSFGSADHTNETAKALCALARPEFRHLHVNVVLGPNHADPSRVITAAAARSNTTVHYAPESLAELIMTADFALGAAGTTVWERLCLMLPSAVTVTANNQTEIARCLAADGYIDWIGFAADTTAQHYITALANAKLASPQLPRLVDGLGARRCVEFMAATMREKRIKAAP